MKIAAENGGDGYLLGIMAFCRGVNMVANDTLVAWAFRHEL